MNSYEPGVGNDRPEQIIISLTTHSHRIDDVYLTIESLMRQTLQADRIILNVDAGQHSANTLPDTLIRLQQRGLEVYFAERDLGPYTKYFYTLSRFADALIITVDDDILYPIDMVSKLYRAYRSNPEVIHCHRAHQICYNASGTMAAYQTWNRSPQSKTPSLDIFPTGVGGVLYFPGCFHSDVFAVDKFMKLAPKADDVWLKAMSMLNQVKCQKIADDRDWEIRFPVIPGSQKTTLKRENKKRGIGNDQKLKAVFQHYKLPHTSTQL